MESNSLPEAKVESDAIEEKKETFQVEENLSSQQETDLLAFLMKCQKACGEDNSVPDFVGSQVSQWLLELQQKESKQEILYEKKRSNS